MENATEKLEDADEYVLQCSSLEHTILGKFFVSEIKFTWIAS